MQPGVVERCLLLLSELLAAGLPLAAATAQHTLLQWLTAAVGEAADELASYASLSAVELWQPGGGQHGVKKAQLVLDTVCASLRLLMSREPVEPSTERLATCCLEVLQSFVAGSLQLETAGACPDGDAAQAWQQAAAQLLPVADCSGALAAAVKAGWAQGHEQQQMLAQASSAAAAALQAVLSLQAAAAAAAAAGDSGLPVYCHRLCWKAIASLLSLLQQLQQAQPHEQWEQQQASALAAALNALQHSPQVPALAADQRCLLLQLSCCRLLLPETLQQQRVGQLALGRQQRLGPAAAAGTDGGQEAVLAGWLCDAAWQAYKGAGAASKRRWAGLTAALVSTCLHPALFEGSAARWVRWVCVGVVWWIAWPAAATATDAPKV